MTNIDLAVSGSTLEGAVSLHFANVSNSRVNTQNNIFRKLSTAQQQEMIKFCEVIVKKYGPDPATKDQAAAHEASHLIMASVMGEVVTGARIFKMKNGWYGCNYRQGRKEVSKISENPLLGFAAICNNLAGKIGEEIVGYDYAASSIDEMYRALTISKELDDFIGCSSGRSINFGRKIVLSALTQYRYEFDIIRECLLQKNGIKSKSLASILKKIELHDIFQIPEKEGVSSNRIKELADCLLRLVGDD